MGRIASGLHPQPPKSWWAGLGQPARDHRADCRGGHTHHALHGLASIYSRDLTDRCFALTASPQRTGRFLFSEVAPFISTYKELMLAIGICAARVSGMSVAPPRLDDRRERGADRSARVCARARACASGRCGFLGLLTDRYGSISVAVCGLGGIVSLVVGLIGRFRGAASTASGSGFRPVACGCIITTIAIHLLTTTSLRSRPRHQLRFVLPRLPGWEPVHTRAAQAEPARHRTANRDDLGGACRCRPPSRHGDGWTAASGKVRVTIEGRLGDFHSNDLIELVGRLSKPLPPRTPASGTIAPVVWTNGSRRPCASRSRPRP